MVCVGSTPRNLQFARGAPDTCSACLQLLQVDDSAPLAGRVISVEYVSREPNGQSVDDAPGRRSVSPRARRPRTRSPDYGGRRSPTPRRWFAPTLLLAPTPVLRGAAAVLQSGACLPCHGMLPLHYLLKANFAKAMSLLCA